MELTVEQVRSLAQNWLAEVRRGGDPGGDKAHARKVPTVKELCIKFKPGKTPGSRLGRGAMWRCTSPGSRYQDLPA